jgi:hypothetical protein
MKHHFRATRPKGPIDPAHLKAFESTLGATLPEPYRGFLVKHNGCTFGSAETPTTFFGLRGRKHDSIAGPTYPNPDFLPPEVLAIGKDYGDTLWLIGVAGGHRGKAFRAREGSEWESASAGGDVWENVGVVAPDFPSLLDLIAARGALDDGDERAFAGYLDEGHDVNAPLLGSVPLEAALARDHLDLARFLVGRGADPKKVDDTLFRDIGATGSLDALLFYADAVGDIDRVVSQEGWTLLDMAVWQDHVEAAKALLDRGAKPNKETFRLASTCGKPMRTLLAQLKTRPKARRSPR